MDLTANFAGQRVFITGGSSGIGKAAARLLVEAGAYVGIAARNPERLAAAEQELRAVCKSPDQVVAAFQLDVSDRQACRDVAEQAVERLGGMDVLINNAGVARPGYIQDLDDDVFDEMMRTNYFGTVNVTRAFLPHFMAQRRGHIANVSSLVGFMGVFGYTAYAASKFAVAGFTDALRQELIPYGVGTSVVFPADTDTPQLHAENEVKPPETKAIAGNVKVMSPEAVAREMLEGIATRRYHICPGFGTKFTYFMYRHFPGVTRWVIDNDLKKYLRKQGHPG